MELKITNMIKRKKKEDKMEYRSPVNNSLSRGPVYGNGISDDKATIMFMSHDWAFNPNSQQILRKIYLLSLLI